MKLIQNLEVEMKSNKSFLFVTVVLLAAYVLSACGGVPAAAPAEQAAVKVDASLVAYTGTLEGINGDQWIVNGQALTIDPAVVQDGPFQVGDTVKVEGDVNPDGSFTVSRIEAPSASDLTELPQLGNENANANSNDANTNDVNANTNINDNTNVNSNDDNSNDDNININSNDNNSNDDDTNMNSNEDNSNGHDDDHNDDSNRGSKDDSSSDDGGHDSSHDSGGDDHDGNSNDD
jgi:hypothetical protein